MRTLFCLFLLFTSFLIQAQSKDEKHKIKFGKITGADFVLPDSLLFKEADAVVIADVGSTEFIGNTKGRFTLVFKRHVRIKVNTVNGAHAGDFIIPLYVNKTGKENVDNLKGITYNLENGAIIETPLDEALVFEDKRSEHYFLKKFSMPGVKAGSVIDVSYTLNSDFYFNLQPWEFQGAYPRIWSEYTVNIPDFFNYVLLTTGYQKLAQTKSEGFASYKISYQTTAYEENAFNVSSTVSTTRWVAKNVPPLKEEPFTTSLENHIAKIQFQLKQINFSGQPREDIMSNWPAVVVKMNNDERFGLTLDNFNLWLNDDLRSIGNGISDTLVKAQKIFDYVRDNLTCTYHYGGMLTGTLKDVLKNRSGNAADINLLLVAMLMHKKIEAYPVLLSTRNNGWAHEVYPLLDRYNYVICVAYISGKKYYLDATGPNIGFNKLPLRCYNGQARIIAGDGIPVYFEADSLSETKFTTLTIINTEEGKWEGGVTSSPGYYESVDIRNKVQEIGKDDFFKGIQKKLPEEYVLTVRDIENFYKKEEPVIVKYEFEMDKSPDEDLVYFNPMFGHGYSENPFKSAERFYPVEMSYTSSESYVASIEIPKGYKVDEVPRSARVNLNEEDGSFEYIIAVQNEKVMLRSRLILKHANFPAEDYQTLREFFAFVVKKQSEQVVFKKIK